MEVTIWNHKEDEIINSMSKEEIIENFKGGVTLGEGIDEEELLLDEKGSKNNTLSLQAYDANMMPSPDFSSWNPEYKNEIINAIKKAFKNINLNVLIDSVKVKERKEG